MAEKELAFHEAADIFPLDEEHLDELAGDIRKNGQQVAIEIFDGQILDGRRRYLACKRIGIWPRSIEVDVADPIAYVLSLNLHRRHLSPTQLSMVGARAREIYDRQAKERQKRKPSNSVPVNLPEQKGDARDHAAKAVGVSGKSVDFATKVLKDGTEALKAAVDADLIAISTAASYAGKSHEEQNALVKRVKQSAAEGHRHRPRPTITSEPEPELHNGNGEIKARGVGVDRAHEAINCLKRIPKNDGLRKRGFQIVTDWIRDNK